MKDFNAKQFEPEQSNKDQGKAKTLIENTLDRIRNLEAESSANSKNSAHSKSSANPIKSDPVIKEFRQTPGQVRVAADIDFEKLPEQARGAADKNLQRLPEQARRAIDQNLQKLPEQARRAINEKARKLADDYFKQVYLGTKETPNPKNLPGNTFRAKLEINSLANLILTKKPETSEEKLMALLDQLFSMRREAEEYRIKDEIARLQILLADEEAKFKDSETKGNRGFITELKNQILQLSREAF